MYENAGYILYEMGYDIWMANARGNVYSKGHLKYNRNGWRSDRKKYWNFSWHEIGKYDIPATIDYILEKTNFTKVHYIGHSQGTTSFFVMMSERPEYNDKVLFATVMAPAVFMGHVKNELLQLNVRHLANIEVSTTKPTVFSLKSLVNSNGFPLFFVKMITEWIGFYAFNDQANNLLVQTQNSVLCYLEVLRNTQLCNNNFSPLVGNITGHVNRVREFINCHRFIIQNRFTFVVIIFTVNDSCASCTCTSRSIDETTLSLWSIDSKPSILSI